MTRYLFSQRRSERSELAIQKNCFGGFFVTERKKMGILGLVTSSGTRDAALASAGSKTTAAGAGVSVFGLVASQEFISIAGIAIALFGFGVNWYYKHKDAKNSLAFREREDARA